MSITFNRVDRCHLTSVWLEIIICVLLSFIRVFFVD